ncbi:N-acetylmuramoyl-L-alanine amidase CwlD [Clostridium chauvoei]|uniref:N-acetylmuramoyl-L-alanine amidase CwlD n=2 Tax=Clostridium chauvoei TaxID=46867 RepID=A0ABD4RH38_9CLOT|nr:N-acetylmuramoyl-L-alanine amidase CwlD [Clostridium chauvoei]ATD53974.1 N-acetylmuramoyl-L-alanine amidase CwlD [Clostridium chauvoei]ATD58227.1 N-acetylmuramoyl-L-alanine amidase CwlD [Clostridium chauvoei]MBX7280620.1 N-acetylmuramoyl-L-alanine amidase CwlD [Clostridium chauvoei]MBX7283052.1 N-acetylmuramoyl-L-alanine amidase CwlD [Clostridium chauvoei]MBX7285418.1 N-acetylmuramoyl-L-alanine amidase CwlD [Clostridium chauvoei]
MKKFKKVSVLIVICLIFSLPITIKAEDTNEKIILIDPGHGGFDGGAQTKSGTIEKDVNIAISLKLKENLEKKGYKVYMTRTDDNGLNEKGTTIREKKREDLKKRCELKKETKCDAFISIHQNMFPQAKCYGAQVWYSSNDISKTLATNIQEELKQSVKDNNKRVAKPAGESYLILRDKYEGASVLVECGFLSNPDEEAKLKTDEHQNALVEGISNGLDKYFKGENSNLSN